MLNCGNEVHKLAYSLTSSWKRRICVRCTASWSPEHLAGVEGDLGPPTLLQREWEQKEEQKKRDGGGRKGENQE